MKICIISDVFPPSVGGIQTFTSGLVEHLSRDGRVDKVSVITFGGKRGREIVSEKLDVFRLPDTNFLKKGLLITQQLSQKRDYDIFHSTTLLPAGFFTSYFSNFLAHKKSFVTIYGLDALGGFRNMKTRFLIKRVFNRSDGIISFSNFTKNEVGKLYELEKDKLTTIYPGILVSKINQKKVNDLAKRYRIGERGFIVLFVGRLVERKGVDDLIQAIGKMKGERVKLLVIGEGPEKEKLVRLVMKLELQKKVLFAESVPYHEIPPFYGLADVFCMPSKYLRDKGDVEGLGLVFLEAQSYGIPVIGTRSGGVPEVIDDGKSGFIVPEGDPSSIRDRLLDLMNDENLRDKMGKHAIGFVKRKFSWKRCVDEHIELYEG